MPIWFVIAVLVTTIARGADYTPKVDQKLAVFLSELAQSDEDLTNLIKERFAVSSPQAVDFLISIINPVHIGVETFKNQYTDEEIMQIIEFHTSDTGRKFMQTFPHTMQLFAEALDEKIKIVQIGLVKTSSNNLVE